MNVDKNSENMKLCLCLECPSYTEHCKLQSLKERFAPERIRLKETNHVEKMFCAYEKSNCIYQRSGCLCSVCEVSKKYNLRKQNYCLQTGGL